MKNSIQILKNNAELDTTTVYHENGDIQVYACPWNEGAEPLTDGNKKTYRARITMAENGDFTVKAYRIGSQGPRYRNALLRSIARCLNRTMGNCWSVGSLHLHSLFTRCGASVVESNLL